MIKSVEEKLGYLIKLFFVKTFIASFLTKKSAKFLFWGLKYPLKCIKIDMNGSNHEKLVPSLSEHGKL